MKKIVCLFLISCLFQFAANAQPKTAFKDGEVLTFTASYKMSGFMTQLAQLSMETSEVKTTNSSLYHFKCRASTYKKFDAFFRIRDLYESYVSKSSLVPFLYRRNIEEGGYKKKMKYVYNRKNNTIKSTQTKRRGDGTDWVQETNFNFSNQAMDVVSTLYNLRDLPIANARIGDTKTFKVIFDRKETPVTIKYVGKETIDAGNLGSKECYKLEVITSGDFLKSGTLWLTADANKIPVQAKFTIPIGSGMLQLTNAVGVAN
ncbi:DUF3108 domain-containing protein [Kordia sp.]|uniref:DUF3108 domain-containing protein n=1 Tax=Kordia sp. TaxID=1965332 RepID=UPI003D2985DC